MASDSLQAGLVPVSTSSVFTNFLNNFEKLPVRSRAVESKLYWKHNDFLFNFDALSLDLKQLIWKEMASVNYSQAHQNAQNPKLEQDYQMKQSRVNKEWYSFKGHATKYYIGMEMDIVGLAELFKKNESKAVTVKELNIYHEILTYEQADALATILRLCKKIETLSFVDDGLPDDWELICGGKIAFSLAGQRRLRKLTIHGELWEKLLESNPYIFSCLTKLTDLQTIVSSDLPADSGLASLTNLGLSSLNEQSDVDILPSSFYGSYNTLKTLELWFDDEIENYNSLNEFIGLCVNLESLTVHFNAVGAMQDSEFLNETLPKLHNLNHFSFAGKVQPLSLEFIYLLPSLKSIDYEVWCQSDHVTPLLIDLLEQAKGKRKLGIEKVTASFVHLRHSHDLFVSTKNLMEKIKNAGSSIGIEVIIHIIGF